MKFRLMALVLTLAMVFLATVFLPEAAWAQAASTGGIAGDVKDTSGAVLPGVTVEAASPALIEKVRTGITDGQGKFSIIDLRPGTYTVTFSLPGFATVRREGIELASGFTAAIDTVMRVGAVEETITVTGASPIVDTQNVRTQNVLSQHVLDTLPTAKALPGLAALTLGTTGVAQDVGGNRGETPTSFAIHGGRSTDQRIKYDGMAMNSFHTSGGGPNRLMLLNQVGIQEMVLETGGISAESETGGVQINAVPRDGGNRFSTYFVGNYTNNAMQGNNITPELTARGVATPPSVEKIYDWGLGVGGPIRHDKLWFYAANRWWGAKQALPNAYYNATLDTPFYVRDLSRPAFNDNALEDHGGRLTWQAAAKHKITVSENAQRSCVCPQGPSATNAPEATAIYRYGGSDGQHNGFHHLVQTSWSHPATNRLLIDGGASFGYFLQANVPVGDAYNKIGITDTGQNIAYNSISGGLFSANYSIDPTGRQVSNGSHNLSQRFSTSYVTGSHAFKVGSTTTFGIHDVYRSLNRFALQYTFRNQVPTSLCEWKARVVLRSRLFGLGLYAQDQWRIQGLALTLGARFDTFNARTLAEHLPAAPFVGPRDWPAVSNVPNWKDVTPRIGAAYDLFGDGKTALKASLGRYVIGIGVSISEANHPAQAEVNTAIRTWNDSFYPEGDARRGNYVPDCDLKSASSNGECGALSNSLFGTSVVRNRYDPALLDGFGDRDYSWQGIVSLQHELRPGIGVNAGYFRRWYGNFRITENVALTANDFDSYCVTVPNDSRLAGAGQPLCGFFDVRPTAFGREDFLVRSAESQGKQTEVYNGLEFSVNARIRGRGRLAGGMSTGRTVFDSCDVVDSPTVSQQPLFCRFQLPWRGQTQLKLNGSYPLPAAFEVSAVLQNLPGIPINASYSATNAEIRSTLGRNLGQCGASVTCTGTVTISNLYEPNTKFDDRLSQLDVRLTRNFMVRGARVQGQFDVYNLLNANTVLALNNRYSATGTNAWLQPSSILAARLFKFGVQFEF